MAGFGHSLQPGVNLETHAWKGQRSEIKLQKSKIKDQTTNLGLLDALALALRDEQRVDHRDLAPGNY